MLKQIVIASVLMIGTASATCGPQLTLDGDVRTLDGDVHGGYYDSPQATDNDNYKIGFKITIPLGEDYCERQELAKLNRDKAYAIRAELDNVEKALRLCKQYGDNHPLLEGKCK